MDDLISIFYHGSKTFWKTRTNIEILIVDHVLHSCFEVIIYEPSLDVEATRLYLNSDLVLAKVKRAELEERLSSEKEKLLRQKKTICVAEIAANITHDMAVQYIISRINVPDIVDTDNFSVFLQPSIGDVINDTTCQLDVICSKPKDVEPYNVEHIRNLTPHEFSLKMQQFNSEKSHLDSHCKEAIGLSREAVKAVHLNVYNLSEGSRAKLNRTVTKLGVINALMGDKMTITQKPVRPTIVRRGSVDDSHIIENTGSFSSTSSKSSKCHCGRFSNKFSDNTTQHVPNIHQVVDETLEKMHLSDPNHTIKRKINRKKSIMGLINGENINLLPDINVIPLSQPKQQIGSLFNSPNKPIVAAAMSPNSNSSGGNISGGNFFEQKRLESVAKGLKKYSLDKVEYSDTDSGSEDDQNSDKPAKHSKSFDYDHQSSSNSLLNNSVHNYSDNNRSNNNLNSNGVTHKKNVSVPAFEKQHSSHISGLKIISKRTNFGDDSEYLNGTRSKEAEDADHRNEVSFGEKRESGIFGPTTRGKITAVTRLQHSNGSHLAPLSTSHTLSGTSSHGNSGNSSEQSSPTHKSPSLGKPTQLLHSSTGLSPVITSSAGKVGNQAVSSSNKFNPRSAPINSLTSHLSSASHSPSHSVVASPTHGSPHGAVHLAPMHIGDIKHSPLHNREPKR